jgi:protein O-mannosyl-transferase
MAAAALGVFSKESAVALPAVIALYELTWWGERRRGRALALGCLAVAPALAALLYQRAALLSKLPPLEFPFCDNPLVAAGFWEARLTALRIGARYLGLLVWPARLSCDYSYAQIPAVGGGAGDWAAWAVAAALAALALWAFRRERVLFFAIGFAFVTFLPSSNLILRIGAIMAERFLYLPAIGFAICLVVAADALGRKTGYARLAPAVLAVTVALFMARTWARNADWRDEVTLMTAAVEASPNSYKTHDALASALYEADPTHANLDLVMAETAKALAILDGLPEAQKPANPYWHAGRNYLLKGQRATTYGADGSPVMTPEGRQAYQDGLQALLRCRSIMDANCRRATARAQAQGAPLPQRDAARFAELEGIISSAYLWLGDSAQSINAASAAIRQAPGTVSAYHMLASALLIDGKPNEAAIALFEGLLATSSTELREELAHLYQEGVAGNGCALVAGPNGPAINPSCETVRRHACAAASRLLPAYEELGLRDQADQLRRTVGAGFGCR